MTQYRIIAVSEESAEKVRAALKSPQYGHPAYVEAASGYGPCRCCLRKFEKGKDERILFTYNPFEGLQELPTPGPIYIHLKECRKYEGERFPDELRDLPLVLEGYKRDGMIKRRERINDGEVDERIEEIMKDIEIEYIQVRNGEAGCYITRIERAVNGS